MEANLQLELALVEAFLLEREARRAEQLHWIAQVIESAFTEVNS
jgi:hypothetical protein